MVAGSRPVRWRPVLADPPRYCGTVPLVVLGVEVEDDGAPRNSDSLTLSQSPLGSSKSGAGLPSVTMERKFYVGSAA
jgi:hypothetical protein